MAKTQGKASKTTWLLGVYLLAAICILLSLVLFKFYFELEDTKNNIVNLNEKIVSLNSELDTKTSEVNTLHEQLNSINDIDDSISSIRQEYFKLAVEADEKARNHEVDFKVCYLTFDDGPYRSTTPEFLDILDEKDVLATFFLLKKEGVDDLYFREMYACHTLANHTAHHNLKRGGTYASEDAFIADIEENREFIQNLLGYTTEVMRFPGGSPQATYSGLSKSEIVSRLKDMHYGYVDWTLTTGDGEGIKEPDVFLHNVIDYSSRFDVLTVLMHDYSANTAACLGQMIDELSNQGFIFLPLCYDSMAVKKQ